MTKEASGAAARRGGEEGQGRRQKGRTGALRLSMAELEARCTVKKRQDGSEWAGPCPNPACSADEDGFLFWPTKGNYYCRKCGLKGYAWDAPDPKGFSPPRLAPAGRGKPFGSEEKAKKARSRAIQGPKGVMRSAGSEEKAKEASSPARDLKGSGLPRLVRPASGTRAGSPGGRVGPKPSESEGKPKKAGSPAARGRQVQAYTYYDLDGSVLFEVVRYEPKAFRQRRPDGRGGWIWNTRGVKKVLYMQNGIMTADAGQWVFVCEGEKSALDVSALGLLATTNPGGAGQWREEYTATLSGRRVAILPDNDEAGEAHAQKVYQALQGRAAEVRMVKLPGLAAGEDVSDWIARGGTAGGLMERVEAARQLQAGEGCTTWADMKTRIGPIRWAWEGWLPEGMLTLVAGEPGEGKSILCLRVAACFLSGAAWPDGAPFEGQTGGVLWCEAEAAQALNLERARAWGLPLEQLYTPLDDPLADVQLDSSEHREAVTRVAARPEVRLIVVDSLRGAQRGDENSSASMETVKWLAELGRDRGLPVLLTHHLRKRGVFDMEDKVSLDRVRGSSAILQAARLVWAVDRPDAAVETRRLSVIKSNLARFPEPLGFAIGELGVTVGAAPAAPKRETQIERAIDLLRALLSKGPVSSAELEEEARGAGVSWDTLKRAKEKMGVVAKRDGRAKKWTWSLPAWDEPPPA